MNIKTDLKPHPCRFVCRSRAFAHLVLTKCQTTCCLLSKAAPPRTAWRLSKAQRQRRLKVMAIGFALGEGEEKPGKFQVSFVLSGVSVC